MAEGQHQIRMCFTSQALIEPTFWLEMQGVLKVLLQATGDHILSDDNGLKVKLDIFK